MDSESQPLVQNPNWINRNKKAVILVCIFLLFGGLAGFLVYWFMIRDDSTYGVAQSTASTGAADPAPAAGTGSSFGNTVSHNSGFGNTRFGDEDKSEVEKLLPGGSFPGSISIGNPTDALKQHLSKPRMGVVLSNSATNLHSIRGDPEIDTSTMEKSWGIMQSAKKMDQQYGRDRHVVRSGFEMKTQWKSPYDGLYPKIGEK